jgi:hypothetical protein
MRYTYTDLKNKFLYNIGKAGSSDTSIIADFQMNLAQRYQLIFGVFKNYQTQQPKTASTVASQQYYHYPNGVQSIDSVYITIGSVKYPLTPIYSEANWDVLNAIQIQPSAIPQFIFPRRDDFGVWPIPQDTYTITFMFYQRDRNLLVEDETTGTVTCESGSTTVTGTSTSFTPGMVGRWFSITDTSVPGHSVWFRIASYTSTTSLELENAWQDIDIGSAVTYKIGESPEIPEEGHIILVDGVTADFYSGMRSDITKATWFNNKFWTGDGNNPNRDMGNDKILGGLIGLANRYADRDSSAIINRGIKTYPPAYKVFATTISS